MCQGTKEYFVSRVGASDEQRLTKTPREAIYVFIQSLWIIIRTVFIMSGYFLPSIEKNSTVFFPLHQEIVNFSGAMKSEGILV